MDFKKQTKNITIEKPPKPQTSDTCDAENTRSWGGGPPGDYPTFNFPQNNNTGLQNEAIYRQRGVLTQCDQSSARDAAAAFIHQFSVLIMFDLLLKRNQELHGVGQVVDRMEPPHPL